MIEIGKAIYSILTGHTGTTALVPAARIYPVILPEKTDLPAFTFTRRFDVDYDKDGCISDNILDFTIVSFDYEETIKIALQISAALNYYYGTSGNKRIFKIRLIAGDEAYEDDAFVQRLSFAVKSAE